MNYIMLVGRSTRDPESRTTESGKKVVKFGLAVKRKGKSSDHPEADFFNCTAWEGLGGLVEKYCHKGERIGVVGFVQTGKFTDKNGAEKERFDVIVQDVEFLESKKEQTGTAPSYIPTPKPESLPFEI